MFGLDHGASRLEASMYCWLAITIDTGVSGGYASTARAVALIARPLRGKQIDSQLGERVKSTGNVRDD